MSDDLELVKRLRQRTVFVNYGNGNVGDVPDTDCNNAADAIERLTAEVAALKTEVKTANTRLEAEQWARKHVKSVIVSDLEKALSEAQAEAARLRECLTRLKDHPSINAIVFLISTASETKAVGARELIETALRGEDKG